MNAKLFLGYRIHSDFKLEVQKIFPQGLQRVRCQEKEFLGLYFSGQPSYQEVKRIAEEILSILQRTYPEAVFSQSSLMLFSQVFLG